MVITPFYSCTLALSSVFVKSSILFFAFSLFFWPLQGKKMCIKAPVWGKLTKNEGGILMNSEEKFAYSKYVEGRAARSPVLKNAAAAFWVGGLICMGGEWLYLLFSWLGADTQTAGTLVCVSLIFLAAALTGLGLFDRIARYAGAGTLLPITGFANAVVSPALDTKSEGWVMGVGAKIFTVAGPVLLYGILAGAAYGVVYWIITLF